MRALLTAADVFIAATAGLSCIEAHLCGCPTICYGFSIGHVRDNTMALQALGRATVASNVRQLPDRIEAELERGRPQPPPPPHLPTAADLLIPLALSSTTRRG
jgi:UDP-N-acetylglucosamine:LPS N-acetylglucosamine transferase